MTSHTSGSSTGYNEAPEQREQQQRRVEVRRAAGPSACSRATHAMRSR